MLTDHKVLLFGAPLLFLFLLHRTRRVKQNWKSLGSLPAYSVLVSPIDALNSVLPRVPWVSYGADWSCKNVYERQSLLKVQFSYPAHSPRPDVFAASKSDIVQIRSLFPYSTPQLIIADATAAKVGHGTDL